MGALDARCACGETRVSCQGPAAKVVHCQCRDCQRLSGTGHMTVVVVDKASTSISGPVTVYSSTADSGNVNHRSFCAKCGSHMLRENSAQPDTIMIYGGTLDSPDAVEPSAVIFHKSAARWDTTDSKLPVHEEMPPT